MGRRTTDNRRGTDRRVVGPCFDGPFFGAILAIVVDFSDLFMMNLIDFGEVWDYQSFDKWIDQVYMLTFLWGRGAAVGRTRTNSCDISIRVPRNRILRLRIHRIPLDASSYSRTSSSSGS